MKAKQLKEVSIIFRVLGEPTRLKILSALMERPCSVGELVALLDAKQANISKQLSLLSAAGLVRGARKGNRVQYRISNTLVRRLCTLVCSTLAKAKQRPT